MSVKNTVVGKSVDAQVVPVDDTDYWGSLVAADETANSDATPAFVGFYNKKSNEKLKLGMETAGGKTDQYYLARNGAIIPLAKFQYHLLESTKVFTEADGAGKIINVSKDDPGNDKFKEHGVALILLKLGDQLVPAKFQARSSAYRALKDARQMGEIAKNAEKFAQNGEAYKVAANCAIPPARFIATASATMEKANSGNEFIKANCTTSPAKMDDINLFLAKTRDPAFMKELTAVRSSYTAQVKGLLSKAK